MQLFRAICLGSADEILDFAPSNVDEATRIALVALVARSNDRLDVYCLARMYFGSRVFLEKSTLPGGFRGMAWTAVVKVEQFKNLRVNEAEDKEITRRN